MPPIGNEYSINCVSTGQTKRKRFLTGAGRADGGVYHRNCYAGRYLLWDIAAIKTHRPARRVCVCFYAASLPHKAGKP
jgi:hypothetical protein